MARPRQPSAGMYEDVAKESTKGRKRKVDEAAHEDAWVRLSRTEAEAMEQGPPEGAANDEAMEDFRREIQLVEAMTDREAQQGETAEAERIEEEEDNTSEDKELEERFVQQQLVDKVKELQNRRMKVPKRKEETAPSTSEKQQEQSNETNDEDTGSEEESYLLFDWRAKSLQQAKE